MANQTPILPAFPIIEANAVPESKPISTPEPSGEITTDQTTPISKPKRSFNTEDYMMWFSDSFSLDKPRQILNKAPWFAPAELLDDEDLEGDDAVGKEGKEGGEQEKGEAEKEKGEDEEEKEKESEKNEEAEKTDKKAIAPPLLLVFIQARDAYLDANEDYYDSLEERGLAWHQADFERDVLPKIKEGLKAKWAMMKYWCEVEGVEECPPQEEAEAYGGPMYRGYP